MGIVLLQDRDIAQLKNVFDRLGCEFDTDRKVGGDWVVVEDKPSWEPLDVEGFAIRALKKCLGEEWPKFMEHWAVVMRFKNPPPCRPPILLAMEEEQHSHLPDFVEAYIDCRDDSEEVCEVLGNVFDREDARDVIVVYLDESDLFIGYLIAGFMESECKYVAAISICD